jgi:DNA-binding MarR family transcriptional regulator
MNRPLPTLLSQVFVAFTIELDNEFEHRMQHRTTRNGSADGPWLVSMAMWYSCMRFLDDAGLTEDELERRARTRTNLAGMRRWGYVTESGGILRPTRRGRAAQEAWRPLPGLIEERWRERFGDQEIDELREALSAVVSRLDPGLPYCLPILRYGLFSHVVPGDGDNGTETELPVLLARVLLAFALEYEHEWKLSLAVGADLLRVLAAEGVPVRDLPIRSGVSKEAISMGLGLLQKRDLVVLEPVPSGRGKAARLTPSGRRAQDAYHRRLDSVEAAWRGRFGEIDALRRPLERLTGDPAERSPLFRGLQPYPDGWRASVREPRTLPHYPMVLHRGGYPDGS